MQQTLKIMVTGKVQGVYYRQETLQTATALGITGTVRNLSDGSVEILATGTSALLQQLKEWCRQGPERAEVKEIKVIEQPLQLFSSFKIIRG